MVLRKFARSGSFTAAHFAKEYRNGPLRRAVFSPVAAGKLREPRLLAQAWNPAYALVYEEGHIHAHRMRL
jgi:hypothetical protein